MNLVYHYIIEQYKILQQDHPSEESFLSMIVNTQIEQNPLEFSNNQEEVSLSKMTYFIESLSILEEKKIFNAFAKNDINNIIDIYQKAFKENFVILDYLKMFKVRLLLGESMAEDTLIKVIDDFSNFLYKSDYLFVKHFVVLICEVIEVLFLIKNIVSSKRVESLIESYIDVLISRMNDVDFSIQQHSFFLSDTSSMMQSLYWEEGDVRKSILLLREDLGSIRYDYKELGGIISQHILLISALSKMESEYFGVQVGILGIISGFDKLYTVTQNNKFFEEGIRWTNILERSIINCAQTEQKLDIRTFIDISLSYNYLKNKKWKM